mgnify:CR=1 FL=1
MEYFKNGELLTDEDDIEEIKLRIEKSDRKTEKYNRLLKLKNPDNYDTLKDSIIIWETEKEIDNELRKYESKRT